MTSRKRFILLTRTLHIYLSMLGFVLLLFFAVTGFLMNHSEWFGVDSTTTHTTSTTVPLKLVQPEKLTPHPDLALVEYLRAECHAKGEADMSFSMDDDPIRVTFKSARCRFDADISKSDGKTTITTATASLSGFLANLHKGENTGAAWHRVIDAASILLALVSLTGILLWMTLAKRRTIGVIALAICLVATVGVFVLFVD